MLGDVPLEDVHAWVAQRVTADEGFRDEVLIDMVMRLMTDNSSFDLTTLETSLHVLMGERSSNFTTALANFLSYSPSSSAPPASQRPPEKSPAPSVTSADAFATTHLDQGSRGGRGGDIDATNDDANWNSANVESNDESNDYGCERDFGEEEYACEYEYEVNSDEKHQGDHDSCRRSRISETLVAN